MAKRINPDLDEGVSGIVSEKMLADLRGLCLTRPGENGDFKELAAEAGVSPSTIVNLCFWNDKTKKQTKRPHFETVYRLLAAFDRLKELEAAFKGEHKPVPRGRERKKKEQS